MCQHSWYIICPNRTVFSNIDGLLTLTFNDPDINANSTVLLQNHPRPSYYYQEKPPGILIRTRIVLRDNTCPHMACMCAAQDTLLCVLGGVRLSPIQPRPDMSPRHFHVFSSLKGSRFVLDKRHQGCSGFKISHGSPLQRGSINWCFNGMPASAPMGAVSNCLHTSAQNNPWMDLIWTSLMHYSTVWKNENVTSLRWHPCKYRLYSLQALVRQAVK
jgi:hypothetical protein